MPAEEEINVAEFAADFASELTGEFEPEQQQAAPDQTDVRPPATQIDRPPVEPPVEVRPLPKGWKKEMEAHWKSLPKEVHDYVYTREGDVSRGIQTYRDGHERWNKLITPYQETLARYPDVDPVGLLNNLMQSHLALSFGDATAKRAMAKQLIEAYGITLDDTGQPPPAIPPEVGQRLAAIEQNFEREKQAKALSHVETFFADPKNEFAKECQDDILNYVKRGFTLEQAYENAMWTNPTIRAKVLAKTSTPAPGIEELNVGAKSLNSRQPAPRKGTMDDTIAGVLAKHYPSLQ